MRPWPVPCGAGRVSGVRHNGGMSIPHALVRDLQSAGYYPQLTGSMIVEALYGEQLVDHLVHMDTHLDLDAIHRHVTVFALTPTRLLLAHVDDEPDAEPGANPRGTTSTEDVPLASLRTALIGRTYADPAEFRPGDRPVEVSLTLGWGAVRRLELFPETCGDPQCEGDHGYSGSALPEDVTLRVSAQAEGQDAVDAAETFALTLKRLVFEARQAAGARTAG